MNTEQMMGWPEVVLLLGLMFMLLVVLAMGFLYVWKIERRYTKMSDADSEEMDKLFEEADKLFDRAFNSPVWKTTTTRREPKKEKGKDETKPTLH